MASGSNFSTYEHLLSGVPSQPLRQRILNEAVRLSEEGQGMPRPYALFLFINLGDLMERVALSKVTKDEKLVHEQKQFVSRLHVQDDHALVNVLFYVWGWLLGDPNGCQIEGWNDGFVSTRDMLLEASVKSGVPVVRGLVSQLKQAPKSPIPSGHHRDFRYRVHCEISAGSNHITKWDSPAWNKALATPGPDRECVLHDVVLAIDGILAAIASFRPPEDKFEDEWIEEVIEKPVEQTPGLFSWITTPIGGWWRAN